MLVVDSKKKLLEPRDIIQIAIKDTGSEHSVEQGEAAVLAEAHMPNAIPMREGNTMFIIHYVPDQRDHGLFRVLNADTGTNYVENVRTFLKAAGLMGFTVLVVFFETRAPLTLFKKIMRKPPFPNMGYTLERSKEGVYRATINMGDTGKGSKQ